MPADLVLLAACSALGAFLGAVTGFGGALVLAPALFATMPPAQAVLLSALLGVAQSGALAFRFRRNVRWADVRSLLPPVAPGLLAGALVLRAASASALRVAVGVAVVLATLARHALRRRRATSRRTAPAVGFLVGALTTSVTINGPPLVLYLGARGASPREMRATLSTVFLALNALVAVPLALTGTLEAPPPGAVLAVGLGFPLGLALGMAVAPWISERAYSGVTTALLAVLGAASIVAGIRA